jgi:peroxiredoxin
MADDQAPSSPRRPRARLWRWVLNLAVLLGLVVAVHWWQTHDLPSGSAPALRARTVSGASVALPDLRGRPTLVHFWAQWCPVCRMENGTIASLARDHPVVTVAMHSGGPAAVREFLRAEGLAFPTVADPEGEIAAAWNVTAVPATFVVDAAGHIRSRAVGYTTELGLRARLWWADRF